MTPSHVTQPTSARLWALEPAIAPMKARYALILGAVFGVVLAGFSQGPLPETGLEEWHGNVAASQTMAKR